MDSLGKKLGRLVDTAELNRDEGLEDAATRVEEWWDSPDIRLVALVLLAVGAVMAALSLRNGASFVDVLTNLGTELGGIALTVLLIEQLNKKRERRLQESAYRVKLSSELGSRVHDVAIRAVEKLRGLGALEDGSLSGVDLENADLRRARLSGAQLVEVNLHGAVLERVELQRARLDGSRLSHANMKEAELHGASLTGADLTGARLDDADLSGANLEGAILDDARLAGAHLLNADLSGASMRRCNLEGAILAASDLAGADLSGAQLGGAHLEGVSLSAEQMIQAGIDETTMLV